MSHSGTMRPCPSSRPPALSHCSQIVDPVSSTSLTCPRLVPRCGVSRTSPLNVMVVTGEGPAARGPFRLMRRLHNHVKRLVAASARGPPTPHAGLHCVHPTFLPRAEVEGRIRRDAIRSQAESDPHRHHRPRRWRLRPLQGDWSSGERHQRGRGGSLARQLRARFETSCGSRAASGSRTRHARCRRTTL